MPSISVAKGRGSLRHNNRDIITENVDPTRTKNNVIYKKESLTEAYEKLFGQAIEDYNSKQKRSDRKIDGVKGYMEKIRNSGNGEKLFYEKIVQIGNMHDCGVDTKQGKLCEKILDEYVQDWQERNPKLYAFNVVMHLDETTPHLHIDYIPVADNYKQGMSVRNSLDKALKQQGVGGKANKFQNSTIAWENREKDHIEKVMERYGLERTPETGLKRKHQSIEHHKAVMQEIENQVAVLPEKIENKPAPFSKDKVIVNRADLEALERRAKLVTVHKESSIEIESQVRDRYYAYQDFTKKHEEEMKNRELGLLKKESDYHFATLEYKQLKVDLYNEVETEKKKYKKLYNEQLELNQKYEQVLNAGKKAYRISQRQETTISDLRGQIDALTASTEQKAMEAVETATKPLQTKIDGLQAQVDYLVDRLHNMCQSLVDVTKAFNYLKFDKRDGYQVVLNQKQSTLFAAIENFVTKVLRNAGKEELAKDVEENISISKGIETEIKSLTPKNRDWER